MTHTVLQMLAPVILLGGIFVGYRFWIKPHEPTMDWYGRGLLLLLVLTFMGGFLGAPLWWLDIRETFAWDVPPLASRMLAAAGWAFAVVCVFVLHQPTLHRLRLVLWLLLVYLVPLAIAIVLFHRNRFDPDAIITYGFFAIVGIMVSATLIYLWRQPRILPDANTVHPPQRIIQIWFGLVSLVTGLWGLALFITDSGSISWIWVWQGDLLSSRLIAVMLLTIATGSVYSVRHTDTTRPMLAMLITYGLGLTIASLWNALVNKPIPLAYVTVFTLITIISAALFLRTKP